jgi:pantoate--beta-alanine ligase
MRVVKTIKAMKSLARGLKSRGRTIGFIPTMGALHEGHLSLIKRSVSQNDFTVISIFVNPAQFGPKEDFIKYPRPFTRDAIMARRAGADIIFYPSNKEMYPPGFSSSVEVVGLGDLLCGKTRPGHFKGVTTVVLKLLHIVSPTTLYLGQKDAQQAIIIGKMVEDLNLAARVVVCPTVREANGLAMSSRNQYLPAGEKKEAAVLYQSLRKAKDLILSGEKNSKEIINFVKKFIQQNSRGQIEYVACVDSKNLTGLVTIKNQCLLVLAVRFHSTRLIDNIRVNIK